jgi:hypothetical protein
MIRAVNVHALEGRIRIHIAGVKYSPLKAGAIQERLGCLEGIINVSANPTTGNVLINYDSHRISQWDIFAGLRDMGYLGERESASFASSARPAANSQWGTMLVTTAIEALLTALIL